MKKIDLGQALSILANFGVLLGILLLAYELNQTRKISQAEFLSDSITAFQEIELTTIDPDFSEIWAKALSDPASLSLADIRTLDAYLATILSAVRRVWMLEQSGFRARGETIRVIGSTVPIFFGNRFAQRWWNQTKGGEVQEFADLLDTHISAIEQSYSRDFLEGLRPDLNEQESGTVFD